MSYQKFSVSMSTYANDNPDWLKEAVESILNSTVKPDEVVLVVDGPIPQVIDDIVTEYESNPIFKVIRLVENQGHGNARRTGLENCSNDLVALMDSDDISLPERFKKQLAVFNENPELSIVGGNITEFINEPENVVGKRTVPENDCEIKEYIKTRCPMNQVTVMFKKKDIDEVGGYIDWFCEEDYYLWLRMYLKDMKFANLPDILVNVRVGEDMYQRRGGIKYFISEAKLQKYMLNNKVIGFKTYFMNVVKRLIVQVLLPNKIRGFVFKKFAREKI